MAAVIAVPALALGQSSTPAVVVTDTAFVPSTVEIPAGGTVSFSYPSGTARHNVYFDAAQPTSCVQTAGDIWTPNPPLPWYTQGPGWAGTCTFDVPGTYPFHSQGNFALTGSVVVVATPTPTPTPSPTATPTATASPAAILAKDSSSPARNWFQDASASDPADSSVTVGPGGSVTFSYPTGNSFHNVVFNAPQPTSCTQTAGGSSSGPPLPPFPSGVGWAGFCTFDALGTYTFYCLAHPEMVGSVVVEPNAPAPTPTPTPTVTATPTPTATATRTPTPTATPIVGGANAIPEPPVRDARAAAVPRSWVRIERPARLSIDALRRGRLRLTARCVSAGSGRVTLTVSKALARRLKLTRRTVGSGSGRCNANGRFTLTVRPTAAAKRALQGYRRPIQVTATLRLARVSDRRTLTLAGKDGL
jgi:plastocyanin